MFERLNQQISLALFAFRSLFSFTFFSSSTLFVNACCLLMRCAKIESGVSEISRALLLARRKVLDIVSSTKQRLQKDCWCACLFHFISLFR